MTDKSQSSPDSVPGQRPPLDPDADTVAIPRPGDELDGENVQQQPDPGKRKA